MQVIRNSNKVLLFHNGHSVIDFEGFEKGFITRNRIAMYFHKHLVVYDKKTSKELFSILGMEIFFFPKIMITKIDGLYGAYSYDNKCILSPQYEKIIVKKHGMMVTKDGKQGFFNFEGNCLHECTIEKIAKCKFYEKYIAVKSMSKWGVYTTDFVEIVPKIYEHIYFYPFGIILSVGVCEGFCLYSGEIILPVDYNDVDEAEEGVIRYRDTNGRNFFFIDCKISVPGDSIFCCSDDRYIIYISGERRVFNTRTKKYEEPYNWESTWMKQF